MGGEARTETDTLEQRLKAEPYCFDFFQVVRRLECAHSDKPRVGHSQHPWEDPVRFGQEPSLAFPSSTLSAYEPATASSPARMYVNFIGLLGPNGPLPLHLTEHARERLFKHDLAFIRFLNLFHHRLISLFYRAWATNQQTVSFERGEGDRYAMYVGSLFGIGMASYRHRDAVPDVAKLHYSGRLASPSRNAEGLQAILHGFFGIPVQIRPFVGQWLPIPEDCRCRLGESRETGCIGATAIVGSKLWECQQTFRIRLGPLGLEDYERMLPGSDSLARLAVWVKNYIGDELRWDVQLVLKAEEVTQSCLGKFGRLGWTTWLTSQMPERDPDDLVMRPVGD